MPDGLEFGLTPVVFVKTERPEAATFLAACLAARGTVVLLVG